MSVLSATQDTRRADHVAAALLSCATSGLLFLLFMGQASLVIYVYPLAVAAIALWLYASRPAFYVSFVLWIWMITPFIRRVIDHQIGVFNPTNLVMLAPLIATAMTLLSIFRFGGRLNDRTFFPLLLTLLGVSYGFVVGIVRAGAFSAIIGLLDWLLPLVFCFHVLFLWKQYPQFQKVVRSTFLWAAIILGSYGIYQYMVAPPWDMFWLIESRMTTSMGRPEAGQFRAFSTLNATGPFARVMMVGVLLLFAGKGFLSRIAMAPGYFSFMLTNVRAAWGGWFVGLVYLVVRLRGPLRKQLFIVLVVGAALVIPLMIFMPDTQRIQDRAMTITNLEQEGSFRARTQLYARELPLILLTPVGEGIGAFGRGATHGSGEDESSGWMDSGIIELPLTLGWPGSLLYLGGLFWMSLRVMRIRPEDADQFAVVSVSIGVALLAMMPFNLQVTGLGGLMAWLFFSLGYAGKLHRENERGSYPTRSVV